MNSFVFRVDASFEIGTGHVIRCLTLAAELEKRGATCIFVCQVQTGDMIDFIRSQGYYVHAIERNKGGESLSANPETESRFDWIEEDSVHTSRVARTCSAKWVIVDQSELSLQWERAVRAECGRLMVIADMPNRYHECDLLLDQNLHRESSDRYRGLVPAECTLRLGPRHALIPPGFSAARRRNRQGRIRRVLVYFGSADTHNQAGAAVDALAEFSHLRVEVLLGRDHPDMANLLRYGSDSLLIEVSERSDDMLRSIDRADLALGACGITTWERCARGLPSLVCITAENQREDAEILAELGAVDLVGDAAKIGARHWGNALRKAIADPVRIKRMGSAAASVVRENSLNNARLLATLLGHVG